MFVCFSADTRADGGPLELDMCPHSCLASPLQQLLQELWPKLTGEVSASCRIPLAPCKLQELDREQDGGVKQTRWEQRGWGGKWEIMEMQHSASMVAWRPCPEARGDLCFPLAACGLGPPSGGEQPIMCTTAKGGKASRRSAAILCDGCGAPVMVPLALP